MLLQLNIAKMKGDGFMNKHEIDMLIAQLLIKLLNREQKERMYLKMNNKV